MFFIVVHRACGNMYSKPDRHLWVYLLSHSNQIETERVGTTSTFYNEALAPAMMKFKVNA